MRRSGENWRLGYLWYWSYPNIGDWPCHGMNSIVNAVNIMVKLKKKTCKYQYALGHELILTMSWQPCHVLSFPHSCREGACRSMVACHRPSWDMLSWVCPKIRNLPPKIPKRHYCVGFCFFSPHYFGVPYFPTHPFRLRGWLCWWWSVVLITIGLLQYLIELQHCSRVSWSIQFVSD